jgi:hypothetical protein
MNHIYTQEEFGENWFNYQNLYTQIVKKFPTSSTFVEVGVWKGKSAAFMCVEIANSNKNIEFFCVDTWKGSIEHQDYLELPRLYEIFKENMKSLENYYKDLKMTSVDASKLFKDESLEFVFIDASHEYEDVKNDLLAWWPKIKKGGILAGHDFHKGYYVYNAVVDVFGHIYKIDGQCFIIEKS